MEKFIAGSHEPEHVIKQLKQKEKPASFCGHVFKAGEPTYSCRDCAVDPSCVFCAACFKVRIVIHRITIINRGKEDSDNAIKMLILDYSQASEHKQHKYKMNMSRGGGYCDCGDAEAWKKGPTCETHDKEAVERDKEDVVPQDMQARLRLVTESVLTYAYQLLTWNKHTQLPTDLEVAPSNDQKKEFYVTIVYNDETHTYEQVSGILVRITATIFMRLIIIIYSYFF